MKPDQNQPLSISAEFMSAFRKFATPHDYSRREPVTKFKFRIMDIDGCAAIDIVDKSGNTVDAADCRGANSSQQRVLAHLQRHNLETLDFDPEWDKVGLRTILLSDIPTVIPALLQCSGLLVDKDLNEITFSDNTANIILDITEDKPGTLRAEIVAELPDTDSHMVPLFIGDSYILAGSEIYPIAYVGDNIDRFDLFNTTFSSSNIEAFLSIFYSFTENITVSYGNRPEVTHKTPLTTEPVLFFEKVDGDNSLYMRVVSTVGNLPANFSRDFNLTRVATVDDAIHIAPLADNNFDAQCSELRKSINASAPTVAARKLIYHENGFYILPQEVASSFLLNALLPLSATFKLGGLDNIKEYKIYPVKPRLNFKVSSGIDYLEGDLTLEIEDQKYTLKEILDEYRRSNCITLKGGRRGIIDGKYLERLAGIFKPVKGTDKVTVSFFDLPEVDNMLEERVNNAIFNRSREVYSGFNALASSKFDLPPVKATLRDYQVQGVKWMNYLRENRLGGCLADDMGLGKTLQTITLMRSIYPGCDRPSLIVMPKSLVFNWQAEIDKFAPDLQYYTYYESNRSFDDAMKAQVILTTYAMVRNDIEEFVKHEFEYVVLDESQNIKNVNAQVSSAVKLLKANHRLALSGTPIENNLTELYSLFSFLNPAMFGSLDDFNSRYTLPIQKDGDEETMEMLRRKIYPFILRRLKRDVLVQLPERVEQRCYVEMTPAHAKFYEERRRYYQEFIRNHVATEGVAKSQLELFKALNELRRIASIPESLNESLSSPKIEPMLDNVVQAVENGHKVVIFFNYIAGIESVGEQLTAAGIEYATITGATQNRGAVVNKFQTDKECKVILMTLKTGGVGINLTAADIVYIFEPWWNPAVEDQAISRLHRMGQRNTVFSYSMITRGTIEEKICKLQEQKQKLFDDLISTDTSITKYLSAEDIDFILS